MRHDLVGLISVALATLAAPDAFAAETFESWSAATAAKATGAGASTVTGQKGWLFFAPELRHLGATKLWGPEVAKVSKATKPEQADPLPAIVDFKDQLERAGVELLIVPVPAKATVHPEFLPPGAPATQGRSDRAAQAFFAELSKSGVNVLDLAPAFLSGKKKSSPYCRTDTHWSGQGCVLAAKAIAAELKTRSWYPGLSKQTFESEPRELEITGDLARGAKGSEKETVALRMVGTRSGDRLTPVPPDRRSPILLLGDSHNLVFHAGADMFAAGAGLPDQLALELGTTVDVLAVRGSGATPARVNLARRARAEAGYLSGKKIVIWCFSVRELTESTGWQKVPLTGAAGGT